MKTNYSLYHDSFTACAAEARRGAEAQGYQICERNWQTEIAFNGKYSRARPDVGNVHRFTVALEKNGRPQRKALNFQVYGMETCFELNAYVN